MAQRPAAPPILPTPTRNYDSRYMDSLVLTLNSIFHSLRNPGIVRGTTMTLVDIKEFADDAAAATGGIEIGGVYRTGSTLKIRVT